jgi:hypothetical protein
VPHDGIIGATCRLLGQIQRRLAQGEFQNVPYDGIISAACIRFRGGWRKVSPKMCRMTALLAPPGSDSEAAGAR